MFNLPSQMKLFIKYESKEQFGGYGIQGRYPPQ